MSMLTTKKLVIDKFGEPTDITKMTDYDEYYYDFGVFEERLNFFDPQISTVSAQSKVSKIENEKKISKTQNKIHFYELYCICDFGRLIHLC